MNFQEVLKNRRSIRNYTEQIVSKEDITALIEAAIAAPSAMNLQPWAFAVIQNSELLNEYSDRAKAFLLANVTDSSPLAKYKSAFSNPDFNIFYNASTLVIIYAKQNTGLSAAEDCSLAAQNLMLAATDKGLGTCWIGFARALLSKPEIMQELGVPAGYLPVAPIIVGYPKAVPSAPSRTQAEVFFWK